MEMVTMLTKIPNSTDSWHAQLFYCYYCNYLNPLTHMRRNISKSQSQPVDALRDIMDAR